MRHLPLIKGDPDMLILHLVAIPELHIVLGRYIWFSFWGEVRYMFHLGVPDKLIFEFQRNVFDEISGKDFMAAFYKKVKLLCWLVKG
jgi:hypothetical protein